MQTPALPAPAATPHAPGDFYARKRANRKCLCTRSMPYRETPSKHGEQDCHARCLKCGFDATDRSQDTRP